MTTLVKAEKYLFTTFSLLLLSYIAYKAIYSPLTNDEASTFLSFVHSGKFLPWLSAKMIWSANNHILNSLLSWLCYKFFGISEWAIRLPNLLALLVYLWVNYRIGSKLHNFFLRWGFWISLLLAPYFIEFFGLCRGYGLSFAFLTTGIYYLSNYFKTSDVKSENRSLIFMVLTLSANLNALNLYIAWLLILLVYKWLYRKESIKLKWLLFRLIPLVYFTLFALKLRNHGELYFGSGEGLLFSLRSAVIILFDHQKHYVYIITYVLVLVPIVPLLISIFKKKYFSLFTITATMFFLYLIAILLQNIILNINYPTERAILIIYPLVCISLFWGIQELANHFKYGYFSYVLVLPLVLAVLKTFYSTFNLAGSSYYYLRQEQIPHSFIQHVRQEQEKHEKPLLIASPLLNNHVWNYNNLKEKGKLNCIQSPSNENDHLADFQIINPVGFYNYSTYYQKVAVDSLKDVMLIRRNPPVKTSLIQSFSSKPLSTSDKFITLFEWSLDSIEAESIGLYYKVKIKPRRLSQRILVTYALNDKDGNTLYYNQFSINTAIPSKKSEKVIEFSQYIKEVPPKSYRLTSYFWNIDKKPIEIESAGCDIYKLHK